ncbi:Peptidase M23 [Candidatus Liberibacter americanus PW_SP]|nr:Peptidase M23 [Candidatus Liberibacter americanus PW_SP]
MMRGLLLSLYVKCNFNIEDKYSDGKAIIVNLVCKFINSLYSSHTNRFIQIIVAIISIFYNQNASAEPVKDYNSQINKTHPKPQFLFDLYKNYIKQKDQKKKIHHIKEKRKNKVITKINTKRNKKSNHTLKNNIYPYFMIPRARTIKSTNDLDNKNNPKIISDKNHVINSYSIEKTPNDISDKDQQFTKYIWPIMSNKFTFSRNKNGIDIFTPPDTQIKSAKNGIVIYAGSDIRELGNTVVICHNNSMSTVYGHLNAIYVKKGQKVIRGQTIALSGNSKNTKKPKLHFELRKDIVAIDPLEYLDPKHNLK